MIMILGLFFSFVFANALIAPRTVLKTVDDTFNNYDLLLSILPLRFKPQVNLQSTQRVFVDSYELFENILPERLIDVNVESVELPQRLFANKYETVEELIENLFGDVDEVRSFNLDKPHDYNYLDIDESEGKTITALIDQLVSEFYLKLWRLFNEFSKVYDILEQLNENDFVAIYDHIYKKEGNDELVTTEDIIDNNWDIKSFDLENILGQSQVGIQRAYFPFIYEDDDDYYNLDDNEVEAQGIKSLIKIILFPFKLIAKILWKLAAAKKLVELAENKVCLTIIMLIQKICNLISELKKEISFEIKVILWSVKSGLAFKKILSVLLLIIKKLKILSWIFKDLLYRYKWKLIFLIKGSKKKSFLIAMYFKEMVYAKLGKMTKEQKRYIDFVNYDDDYYDWDDYDYYKEFSHYVYSKPGTYKSEDPDFQNIIDEMEESDANTKKKSKYEKQLKSGIQFDMEEEFGFDTIRLDIDKLQDFNEEHRKKIFAKKPSSYLD